MCRRRPRSLPASSRKSKTISIETISAYKISQEEASKLVEATTCDIFNEHDASKRRELMEQYWSKDIVCYSPFGEAPGFDAIDQVWAGEHFALRRHRFDQLWTFQQNLLTCEYDRTSC